MEFKLSSLLTLKGKGVSGLENKGNTCFMNAVLQCMSNSQYLTLYFLSDRFFEDRNLRKAEVKLLREYSNLIKAIWGSNCTVDPAMFKITLGEFKDCYMGFNQHDANELYMRLMDMLHNGCSFQANIKATGEVTSKIDVLQVESIKELASHFKKSYSYIVDCFAGQYFGITVCSNCGSSARKYDPFFNMSLELSDDSKTLDDCLKHHICYETLKGDEKWYCEEKCKSKQIAHRRVTIWKTPVYLVLCLKRFKFDKSGPQKLNTPIDFPLDDLDLTKYILAGNDSHGSIYDLYGVVNHIGGPMGGHYFAYCRNADDTWYNYNDSSVSKIGTGSIVSPMAYMLFYKKRGAVPKMLQSADT